MRLLIRILLLLILPAFVNAQQHKIDSLTGLILKATSDTQRINLIIQKAEAFSDVSADSSIQLDNKAKKESQIINYQLGEFHAMLDLANVLCLFKTDYATAKKNLYTAGEILKTIKDSSALFDYYIACGRTCNYEGKTDSSLVFYKKALTAVPSGSTNRKLHYVAYTYSLIGDEYDELANYPDALTYYQKGISIAENINDQYHEAYLYSSAAGVLYVIGDTVKAEQYCLYAIKLAEKIDNIYFQTNDCYELSNIYIHVHKYKEAYKYGMKGAGLSKMAADRDNEAGCLSNAAEALAGLSQFNEAEKLQKRALNIGDSSVIVTTYSCMGDILKMEGKNREAIPFYERACNAYNGVNIYDPPVAENYTSLSECYEKTGNFSKALEAYKTATRIRDTLNNMDNVRKATELSLNYDFKKTQELAKAMQDKKDADIKRKRTQQYFIIAGLAVVVLTFIAIAFIQFRNNKQKQKANLLITKQKEKVESTLSELKSTLSELKSTQAQLIQSEKMASLGELTAGIAHEIQNPLNFVNNFSDLNQELLDELQTELKAGDTEEAMTISNNIKENEEKINHHGKRADSIVKGMLQHSKTTSGQKEPTDINALADEYLRLSYHGMRAKDKSLNAILSTDFDESIGKINIISSDISRVLLNLYNNAFYAITEKDKQHGEGYEPVVSVSTNNLNDKIEIRVKDNGLGIPQKILDKIFQPFFTTKPTGQGTGLGLSLSYDIIKTHGGEIKVNTKEGEFTEFVVQLPL